MDMFEKYLKYKKKYMETSSSPPVEPPFYKQFLKELMTKRHETGNILENYVTINIAKAIDSYNTVDRNQKNVTISNFFNSFLAINDIYVKVKYATWIDDYIDKGVLP